MVSRLLWTLPCFSVGIRVSQDALRFLQPSLLGGTWHRKGTGPDHLKAVGSGQWMVGGTRGKMDPGRLSWL